LKRIEISASGSNVYVTWWRNETGVSVFRASNDRGNTFGPIVKFIAPVRNNYFILLFK
jgi:hypothetical protein